MKRIIFIFPILSILGFIALSLIFPNVAANTVQKKREFAQLKHEETLIPQLSATLSSHSEEIAMLQGAFPKKEDFIAVVQTIDSKAASAGVIVDVHFESEEILKGANGDEVVPLKLTLDGELINILRFIEELNRGKYIFVLGSVEGDAPYGIKDRNKVTIQTDFYASTE